MAHDWVDDELWNWSRWANYGPPVGPVWPPRPGSAESRYRSPSDLGEKKERPLPINWRNAEIVQRVWARLSHIERRVLQAEYLSPWNYGRFSGGMGAAARRLRISRRVYERHLGATKELVRRAFA